MISLTNLKKLYAIAKLKKNWNSYDAEPIPFRVIAKTFIVLLGVPSDVEIFPVAAEAIQIEAGKNFEALITKGGAKITKYFNNIIIERSVKGIRNTQTEIKVGYQDGKYHN